MSGNNRPPRRVLVTGSRSWVSPRVIRDALQEVWGDGTAVLVSGACPTGADRIAEMFWRRWGGQIERHPADWDQHGNRAGFVRNKAMVDAGADICVAFIQNNSPGATNTVRLAEAAGIPVQLHTDTAGRCGAERRPEGPRGVAQPDPDQHAEHADPVAATAGNASAASDGDRDLPWQPDARQEFASPLEVATHYSYPEVAMLVANATPGSEAARIARETLGLLLEQPDLFAGGDQATEIARHYSAAQIARQRQTVDHGPLFEVLGRAAELQNQQTASAVERQPARQTNSEPGREESLRRARWAVDALNQQARAERAAQWRAAGCPTNWNATTAPSTDLVDSRDRHDDSRALGYDDGGVR